MEGLVYEKGVGGGRTIPGRYKEPKAGKVGSLRNGEKSHVVIAKWNRWRFDYIWRIGI